MLLAAFRAFAQQSFGINTSWDPVTDAERQMTAPTVEKDAGAEVLFWTVHVMDELQNRQDLHRVFHHYIRLKVFDEKGKEKVSTIDIEFGPKVGIQNIAARTIKPDGSIVEMKGNAVYERDLVRVKFTAAKTKLHAPEQVRPGNVE